MSTLKTNNIQHVDLADPSILLNSDGSVSIAGTVSYEDSTNVDSVGVVTARKQLHVGTGVSVAAGGLNVTAGITTVQALQATTVTIDDLYISENIVHRGDDNTRIRFPAADTIVAETGGSERLRIDSTGALRINNTRTQTTQLHVVGGTASGTAYNTAVFAGGQNSTQGSGARIILSGCENDPLSRGTVIEGVMTNNSNAHALVFSTSADSSAPAEKMRLDAAG